MIVYGVIVAGGGVMGFKKAASMPSLIMGSLSGLALVISGILVLLGNAHGADIGLGVNFALVLIFLMRYLKTLKMMPAGIMLAISVIVLAFLYTHLFSKT